MQWMPFSVRDKLSLFCYFVNVIVQAEKSVYCLLFTAYGFVINSHSQFAMQLVTPRLVRIAVRIAIIV